MLRMTHEFLEMGRKALAEPVQANDWYRVKYFQSLRNGYPSMSRAACISLLAC
jgi:hypothetical protein